MKLNDFRKVPCIVWCLALTALVFVSWYAATPPFFDSENSPHRVYRLEFHKASLVQRIIHHDYKMPYVVRLYRVNSKKLLGQSQVVDLWMNGEIHWWLSPPNNAVQVGNDVAFENIPPECADPSPPPACDAKH
ncbi:hypothetical protein [Acidovorax sp. SUPP3334]|uniref:hypothetical protein n=1 Tax=Acidovorax sp. SUPP3334 TaxID=2920881 RepID=UPI0023DE59DD|nr:hypothetical protein [Acidovorax sp. SUPP3334]GKT20490.1 hypothetical protein AVHM3334_01185 [Acidovorax sp. SUPP3334]